MSKSLEKIAWLSILVLGVLGHTFIVQWFLTERARSDGGYHLQMVQAAAGKPPVHVTVEDKATRSEEVKVPDAAPALSGLAAGNLAVRKPQD